MNTRRDFFKQLAVGAASFAILPAAKSYERIWKPRPIGLGKVLYQFNPEWCRARYEVSFCWNNGLVREKMGLLLKRKPNEPPLDHGSLYPSRFNLVSGVWQFVPAFIKVES